MNLIVSNQNDIYIEIYLRTKKKPRKSNVGNISNLTPKNVIEIPIRQKYFQANWIFPLLLINRWCVVFTLFTLAKLPRSASKEIYPRLIDLLIYFKMTSSSGKVFVKVDTLNEQQVKTKISFFEVKFHCFLL